MLLFCLYQASHNHDARTLYPLRFQGNNEPEQLKLRRDLMRSCCSNSVNHDTSCSAKKKSAEAVRDHHLLFSTHEAFIHQEQSPQAQLIVVDDLAELQMHLASFGASKVDSEWLEALHFTSTEQEAFVLLRTQITTCIEGYIPQPGFHERLALRSLIRYLREMPVHSGKSVLSVLRDAGNTTRLLAEEIERLCREASQEPVSHVSHTDEGTLEDTNISNVLHVYWLDVWFSDTDDGRTIERWMINGLHEDLAKLFRVRFWQPYQQHVLCGTALTVDGRRATFLERALNLPHGLLLLKDARPKTSIYVPDTNVLTHPGILHRYSWAMQVGGLLHSLYMQSSARKIVVTLNQKALSAALAHAFQQVRFQATRQILSSTLGWSLTKIEERLLDPSKKCTCTRLPLCTTNATGCTCRY